jgi:hypothetical protein
MSIKRLIAIIVIIILSIIIVYAFDSSAFDGLLHRNISMAGTDLSHVSPSLPDDRIQAGFRASQYGVTPFPNPDYWYRVGSNISDKFEGSGIGGIWVVGEAGDNGGCILDFPSSEDHANISFSDVDANEEYLNYFDQKGVSVYLQVEPGNANVSDLIKLVLDRYSDHPCVSGFGIDVEWYQDGQYENGKPVSDAEASAWYSQVKSYNKSYQLFLKHWMVEKMPPTYRDGIYFIDDSQGFSSLHEMTDEFKTWGSSFPDNPVGFQIGYEEDKAWWGVYDDPVTTIGHDLIKGINNTKGIYWVDFSIKDIYP